MQEELAGMLLVVARPLEAVLGLEPGVAHAGVDGRERPDLVPDVLGGRVPEVGAHGTREVDHDVEVVARLAGRLERAADTLHAPLGVGDRALGLGPHGAGREDDVGDLGRLRPEDVLDDDELETLEEMPRAEVVGLRLHGVLADDVERGQLAVLHGLEHLREVPAALGRHRHAPGRVELRAQLVVLDVLEAGQAIGQGAHVAAALDVVLAAQGVEAAAVAPDMTREQGQVDERDHVVDGVVVLGDAERPADHRPIRLCVGVGGLADELHRDARLALGVLERVGLDVGPEGLEVGRGAVDEGLVLEPRGDDLAGHGVGQRDVGADVEPQPAVGPLGARRPARIDGVQPGAPIDPLQEVVEEDRVGLAGVAAPEEDEIRLLDLLV